MSQRNIVLYLGGGAMSGVFGAGVVTTLQEHNCYDRIEAIYGASAGVCNGSYFLTHQVYIGSSIYYEDLLQHFIQGWHLPYAFIQRWWNRYVSPIQKDRMKNAVDIEYMINVMRTKKVLDTKKLCEQSIPLFAKLLNVESGAIEYFDIRAYDPLDIIHAATSVAPYYFSFHTLEGKTYIDGVLKEPIGSDYLFKKHPNSKIVIQMNRAYTTSALQPLLRFVERKALNVMHGKHIEDAYQSTDNQRSTELEELTHNPNALVIQPEPDASVAPHETNKERLLYSYQAGKKKGLEIVNWIS